MSHSHSHSHSQSHKDNGKLTFAVLINVLLTIVQIMGGVLSGSLSLIADALHNLSDAGAIVIAIFARKVSAKKADENMTFGYQRAEIIGTLINSITLIIVGLYLIYEAVSKYFNPTEINGWIVIYIAGIALVIDIATAVLTYMSGAKSSMNLRAAFIHNVSDALASVAVIIAGVLIIFYQWYFVDVIATVLISIYVLYHGGLLALQSIKILMQAVPEAFDISELKADIELNVAVNAALDIHVWQLDEHKLFLECKLQPATNIDHIDLTEIKTMLLDKYGIKHSTIEVNPSGQTLVPSCY
ncbi:MULTISPECIES: cation diffusion facilitator family transporter [unclassified Colwellia]|uniref:cation diffusion facilitator family transporter n=1 Tax=unclassified Colwellia TaxID=196834 RepID=UPI0015F50A12|nr:MULTISPECIES: cation diffusion facilitator family transporter [unclassified Colwellia]MBA6225472.1 cation transporter [Colwellia sp. MB3u-45]MBA6266365.1 cation transporter [Colwellia sp. MB3u-43]MBA6287670.1 cation transporter [Colwellia sp. MB3u-4]MBA6295787.1 cation transporter [Colwellia sp. MB02u-9]MBA6320653.1 cation transporter [Colwellia sp. MB02u-19]